MVSSAFARQPSHRSKSQAPQPHRCSPALTCSPRTCKCELSNWPLLHPTTISLLLGSLATARVTNVMLVWCRILRETRRHCRAPSMKRIEEVRSCWSWGQRSAGLWPVCPSPGARCSRRCLHTRDEPHYTIYVSSRSGTSKYECSNFPFSTERETCV